MTMRSRYAGAAGPANECKADGFPEPVRAPRVRPISLPATKVAPSRRSKPLIPFSSLPAIREYKKDAAQDK